MTKFKIMTGLEDSDGEFSCVVIGESQPNEAPLETLKRMVAEFAVGSNQMRVNEKYDRLGPHEEPTSLLPAVFVGRRGFFIKTVWNAKTKEHELG